MKTLAYERGLSPRDNGGRATAPAFPSQGGSLRRVVRAIRLSPWAPVIGKAIVGIAALLALAALGQAALGKEASAASLEASASAAVDPPRLEPPEATSARAMALSTDKEGQPPPTADKAPAASAILPDGRVVLNLAGEGDLTKLPGIGPKRAQAILALRQRLGRFRRVEDLLRVKGIGRKMLDRIRPAVLLDPPPD